MTYPNGTVLDYLYDSQGRVVEIGATGGSGRPGQGARTQVMRNGSYAPFGPVQAWQFGNGLEFRRTLNMDYRIGVVEDGAENVIGPGLSLGYEFDAVGNLAVLRNGKQIDTLRTYDYDGLDRLTEVRDAQADVWQSYNYDRTGNRTASGKRTTVNMQDCSGTAPGEPCTPLPPSTQWTTRTYGYVPNTHRLLTVGNTERTHDDAGNLIRIGPIAAVVQDPQPGNPSGESASYIGTVPTQSIGEDNGSEPPPGIEIKTFDYDSANRMRNVSVNGELMMSYRYNGRGERVYRSGNGDTVHSLYDEGGHWLGDYDENGTVIQQVIWFDGLPVGVLAMIGSALELYYIEADASGSPRAVIDPVRNLAVWRWDLTGEAFGESEPNMDPDNDGLGFVFDMRYPGQQYDSATGLNYNYFRDYDASVGRYVQSDPIGLAGGISTYGYVGGNPTLRIDPLGLCPCGLPDSAAFWANYPTNETPQADVWRRIGGTIEAAYGINSLRGLEETCAARVSYALNRSGAPIPAGARGANRNWGGDGMRYIVSARQMNEYLRSTYGAPSQTVESAQQFDAMRRGLISGQVAFVSSDGHIGAITRSYKDGFVRELGGDVWILPIGGGCKCK